MYADLSIRMGSTSVWVLRICTHDISLFDPMLIMPMLRTLDFLLDPPPVEPPRIHEYYATWISLRPKSLSAFNHIEGHKGFIRP